MSAAAVATASHIDPCHLAVLDVEQRPFAVDRAQRQIEGRRNFV